MQWPGWSLEYRGRLAFQSLGAIGSKIGLTRERVRQLEHQALTRLRHPPAAAA
jgi:DNA-directed RNA polymerase sigma subunit (sigma70/sigma32)